MVTEPMYSDNPTAPARYLLPFIAILLLSITAGATRAARWVVGRLVTFPSVMGVGVALLPCMILAWTSPLWSLLVYPNTNTLHGTYHFDFRPEKKSYMWYMAVSPFWAELSSVRTGTLRIAAAPFFFESYKWDAPRWERLSRQTVVPGYLTGFCVSQRPGAIPISEGFQFRNAKYLADYLSLARNNIDYVVWQKLNSLPIGPAGERVGADTAHCETLLRKKFGAPAYEDSLLIAFRTTNLRADPP